MRRLDPIGGRSSVVVCVPYFRCRDHIARAVESLLAQTHRNLTVLVINDGDPDPPWSCLARFRDARLVCFDLRANRGPYFATAVALGATSAPFLLIQDADDWSSPNRVEVLLSELEEHQTDFAFSAVNLYRADQGGRLKPCGVDWSSEPITTLTPDYRYRLPHHGLWRSQSLRRIGGYYGGFPMGYDKLLMNALLITGRYSYVRAGLYHRVVRPDSLTMCRATGFHSSTRSAINDCLSWVYARLYQLRLKFLAQSIDSAQLIGSIREACWTYVSPGARASLRGETQRLAALLAGR